MTSPTELVLRLAVAAVLGALVGLERERLEWAAGMRTHALISATLLALALLVLAKPLKARMFDPRKQARRLRLVVERGTPLAELREQIETWRRTTRSWCWARVAGKRNRSRCCLFGLLPFRMLQDRASTALPASALSASRCA